MQAWHTRTAQCLNEEKGLAKHVHGTPRRLSFGRVRPGPHPKAVSLPDECADFVLRIVHACHCLSIPETVHSVARLCHSQLEQELFNSFVRF